MRRTARTARATEGGLNGHDSAEKNKETPRRDNHAVAAAELPVWGLSVVTRRLILAAVCVLGCYATAFYFSSPARLGNPEIEEESTIGSNNVNYEATFGWRLAQEHLKALAGLGPRALGSAANEQHAPAYLVKTLEAMQAEAARFGCVIEVEVQRPSGTFYTEFLGGFTSVYGEVTNVVARLSWPHHGRIAGGRGSNAEEEAQELAPSVRKTLNPLGLGHGMPSILVNAHFDSAPNADGASDDLVGCALMLEAARALSKGPPLNRPVVLLFNGAEETNQQGSHGFITQHRWAGEVGVLANLESMGAGGRFHVFQCNSARVASSLGKAFQRAGRAGASGGTGSGRGHPFGSVIGSEIFSAVLSKSAATDYRTFLEFGPPGLVGFDTAYIENGHVYHTVHDGIHHVPPATLKQAGSTLLAFLQEVGTPGSSFGAKATAATAAAASSTSHSSTTASSSTPAGGIDSSRCSVSSPPLPPYLFELPPVDNGAVFFDFLHSWWISYPAYVAFPLHLSVGLMGLVLLLLSSSGSNSSSRNSNAAALTLSSPSPTSSQTTSTSVEPFLVDWRAAAATVGAEFKAMFAALGASLVCGLMLACFAPMSWNGGAGSPEPNGLGDGAHGLLEHVPFPANLVEASFLPWILFGCPALAASLYIRARTARQWLLAPHSGLRHELRVAHEVETDSATFNSNSGCSSSKDSNHDGSTLQAKGEDGDDDNDVDLNHRTSSSAEAAADAQALWQLEQRLRSSCNAPFAFLLLGGAACGMSSCYLALPWVVGEFITFALLPNSPKWAWGRTLSAVPGTLCLAQASIHALKMVLPMLARSGSTVPPDLLAALLLALLVSLTSGGVCTPALAADALASILADTQATNILRNSHGRSRSGSSLSSGDGDEESGIAMGERIEKGPREESCNSVSEIVGGISEGNGGALGPTKDVEKNEGGEVNVNVKQFEQLLRSNTLSSSSTLLSGRVARAIGAFGVGTALAVALMWRNVYPAYSISRPKRFWAQHIHRQVVPPASDLFKQSSTQERLPSSESSGVFLTAMDGRGVQPMGREVPELDGRYAIDSLQKACHDANCYLEWPWYFPVAEALFKSHFVPTDDNPFDQSNALTKPPLPPQLVARPGQALVQNPPLVSITSQAALLGDGASSSSSFHPQAGARRRITVTVSGPDHMIIVLRDSPKAPILSWSLSEVLPPHREGHFRWIQLNHGTCRAKGSRASANSEDISSSSSSSWRLGGGQGGDACKYTFTLDVDGAETVDIAVYGHYVGMAAPYGFAELWSRLPAWAQGGEFAFFPSALVRTRI